MRLRTWSALFAVGGALIVAWPAGAQSSPPAARSAPVNAKSEALVRRYLAAIHFEKLLDTMVAAMLPLMTDGMIKEHPDITPEQRQMIADTVRDTMREKFVPQMLDRMVPIYASTFSEPELEAIVTFYESPAGRAITEKAPSLAPKSAEITRELMPQFQGEIIRRLCAKIDCLAQKPAAPPKPRAS